MYFEKILWSQGVELVAGIDEVGMGALAGPVVACAVIFPKDIDFFKVKDSKKLTSKERERLYKEIKDKALCIGIGKVSVKRINKINNIYRCGLEAMRKAVYSLKIEPQHLLVDAREIPDIDLPQNRFNNGENINFSIAAASIIAKVHRDSLMRKYSYSYPEYRFAQHKGYATSYHIEILRKIGHCKIHRTSYEFVRGVCGEFSQSYFRLNRMINKAKCKEDLNLLNENISKFKNKISQAEWRRLRRKITFKKSNLRIAIKNRKG